MSSREAGVPNGDHVIGAFPREQLSAALAATHRAGFGPQARVIDGARGDVGRQLERAGLRILEGASPPVDALLIVVTAPGRTAMVADLFARLGAESVVVAGRQDQRDPVQASVAVGVPDIRIERDQAEAPDA
jgi:hypothetical protein